MLCNEMEEQCVEDFLSSFDFYEFREASNLLNDLKEEFPKYKALLLATDDSFWSHVDGEHKSMMQSSSGR
jgi:hypothetical protein